MFDIEAYEAASRDAASPPTWLSRLRMWVWLKRHPHVLVPASEKEPIMALTRRQYRAYVRDIASRITD